MSVAEARPSATGSDLIVLTDAELAAASPEERRRYAAYLTRKRHQLDPVRWAHDVLGETLWSKQREILQSVAQHRRTAVRSCHDSGKSFSAARVVCWWLDTGTPGRRFAVTTAPTGDQVKAILWREINQAHKKGRLNGRTNLTEWYIGGELVALGRKPNDYEPTSFQGIHAPEGVLVVYDEAGGIPAELFAAGQSMAANAASRELAIGNPDDPGSHFATLFNPNSGWNPIHIDGLATPNFTGETVPPNVAASLIDRVYVEDMLREHGETGPAYIAKVRGNFPVDRSDGIVPHSWIKTCQALLNDQDEPVTFSDEPVHLGVDVGAGGDETVVFERRGMKAGRVWRYRHDDAMRSVGEMVNLIRLTGATKVKVDVIGVGFGVHGRLAEVCEADKSLNCEVIAVNVGASADDTERFKNRKAELWWEIARELSRQGAWDLSAVDDVTVTELVEHRYTYDSAGRVKVESKDDVRKRLKRSPDSADALILAFYDPQPAVEFLGVA